MSAGENVTGIARVAPAGTSKGAATSVTVNAEELLPDTEVAVTFNGTVPVFWMSTVSVLFASTGVSPNASGSAAAVAIGPRTVIVVSFVSVCPPWSVTVTAIV